MPDPGMFRKLWDVFSGATLSPWAVGLYSAGVAAPVIGYHFQQKNEERERAARAHKRLARLALRRGEPLSTYFGPGANPWLPPDLAQHQMRMLAAQDEPTLAKVSSVIDQALKSAQLGQQPQPTPAPDVEHLQQGSTVPPPAPPPPEPPPAPQPAPAAPPPPPPLQAPRRYLPIPAPPSASGDPLAGVDRLKAMLQQAKSRASTRGGLPTSLADRPDSKQLPVQTRKPYTRPAA